MFVTILYEIDGKPTLKWYENAVSLSDGVQESV